MDPINSQNLIPLFAIAGGFLIAFSWIVSAMFTTMFRVSRMTTLKLRLLEAGMNSHEIERVCNAGMVDLSDESPKACKTAGIS